MKRHVGDQSSTLITPRREGKELLKEPEQPLILYTDNINHTRG